MRRFILLLVVVCLQSCWSVDLANLPAIERRTGLHITESECDEASIEPLASLIVTKNGFYLLGWAPVVTVSLTQAVEELAKQAKAIGADGICHLRYIYSPPNPLKFLVFPIPDWSASVQVLGMAYRDRDHGSEAGDGTE